MVDPIFIIVDLFCGAGGTSCGFQLAELNGNKIAKVIACINHDHKAIISHWKNHPDVKHFEEDIRTLDLTELVNVVNFQKSLYPKAKLILWASLECTNFSKAKGGLPRNADSRTLAETLYMHYNPYTGKYKKGDSYLQLLNPDYLMIENVVEFMSWGPLDEKGKPVSRKNGSDWMRWRKEICEMDYTDDWKELNSANFGAYTSRNRLFGCFSKHGNIMCWPEPTHAKIPSKQSMYGDLKKWKPVKEVLNFSDEGHSIFTRKKPLSDKTLERIYAGLIKYIAKGDTSFISKYYSGKPSGKNISVEGPAGTITTVGNQTLIQPEFLSKYNSTDKTGKHYPPSINEPCPVVTTQVRLGLIQPQFIIQRNSGNPESKIVDVNGPARTITATGGNQELVQTEFLTIYNGRSLNRSVNEPSPVIATNDRFGLVQPKYFIDKQFSGNGNMANHQSIDQPAGSILANDKHSLIEATPFIMSTNFDNKPKSIEDPLQTITANRKHHYLINPAWGGNPGSVDEPCCVIVARQDKAPLYFVQVESGVVAIAVFDSDSDICIKIKQFMAVYGLVDIKMRMLRILELLLIQGLMVKGGKVYELEGTQSDQKKQIGNSVHPLVPKHWAEAMAVKILFINSKKEVA